MSIQVNGLEFTTGFNGVLGPRGAGKTRLLKQICAHDMAAETGVCYVTQELGSFHNFTVTEYLCYHAGQNQIPKEQVSDRIEECLKSVQLMRYAGCHIFELSKAVKAKTLLAKALLLNAQCLLLDDVLDGLTEAECMNIGYLLSLIAKDRVIVLAGTATHTVEGLFDTVCLMHPDKGAVHVDTNTAYSWVEGKVWEYVAPECPQEGRLVSSIKQGEDGVYVREVSAEMPYEEVSQVTPNLHDAYLWWATQG